MDSYVGAYAPSASSSRTRSEIRINTVQSSKQQQIPQRYANHKLGTSSLSFVPPTPMSAYFDAEDASVDYDENAMSSSSSPPTSSSTNGVRYETGEASSPLTPATPGTWKPRELTLLRSRIGSTDTDVKEADGHPDLAPALDGLGIRGISAGPAAQQHSASTANFENRSVRSAGLRDVLPIVSNAAAHSRTMSNNASSQPSNAPRELRLTGSLGPSYSHRFGASASSSSAEGTTARLNLTPPMPSFRSRSPTLGSSPLGMTTSSRLPVRHGPAFSTSPPDRVRQPAAKTIDDALLAENTEGVEGSSGVDSTGVALETNVGAMSPLRQGTPPSSVSPESGQCVEGAGTATRYEEEFGQESREDEYETLQSSSPQPVTLNLRERKDSITSMETSIIETCAAGSRKKGPPAPLVLLPSPSSTYSKASLEASMPNSALSLPPTSSSAGYEFTNASVSRPAPNGAAGMQDVQKFLGNEAATSTHLTTGPLAGSHDAFLTPLQSPATAAMATTNDGFADREAISAGDLLSRLGTLDLGSLAVGEEDESNVKAVEAVDTSSSHRQTIVSSTSSGNAFEYDSLTESKRQAAADISTDGHDDSSRHTSSLSSQSRKAASPSPKMAFNKHIFQTVRPARQRSDSVNRPQSPQDAKSPSNDATFLVDEIRHGDLKDLSNDNLQAQHSTVDISWNSSASPLSASTSRSTDVTSVASRSRSSEAFEPRLSTEAASGVSRRSISAGKMTATVADGGARRRSSQMKAATKACAEVPEVPSFGYMGTNVTPADALHSQQVSPMTRLIPPQPLHEHGVQNFGTRDEIVGSSHWSSGSEDEDEQRTAFKSGRKGSSRSRKGSQVALSSSANSSRRNTGPHSSQSSLAPLKKSNLFAGLGLRKKSVPNLLSDGSSNASSPMPMPSDSPAVGRADGMREFPFPNAGQSKLSLSVAGLRNGTSSSANSAAPSPISSPIILKDSSGEATVRGPASRFLQRQASTPSLAERFTNTFNGPLRSKLTGAANTSPTEVKFSSATSTSTPPSLAGSAVMKTISLTNSSTESSAPSPVSERGPTSVTGLGSEQFLQAIPSPALQGLGIQVDDEGKLSTTSEAKQTKTTSSDESKRHTRNMSVKSYLSSDSIAKVHDGHTSYLDDTTTPYQSKRNSVRTSPHSRQRSMTINSSERASMEARDAAMKFYNGHRFPTTTFGFGGENVPPVPRLRGDSLIGRSTESKIFSHSRAPSVLTSPNDTPRNAFAPLANVTQPARADDEEADGLYTMGKMLAQSITTPPQSSPSTQGDVALPSTAAKTVRRVRRTAPRARPHYPSLTEFGQDWQAMHHDECFMGALGPALLQMAMQDSSDGRVVGRENLPRKSSSTGTDDYGSSGGEAASTKKEGQQTNVNRGRGDDEDRSDDHEIFKKYVVNEGGASSYHSDDSESDGEYGAEENDLPRANRSALVKIASDDAPIGSTLRDPKQIMQTLQRSGTMPSQSRRRARRAEEARPEMPCGRQLFSTFDAAELSNRLQGLQRASTMTNAVRTSMKTNAQPQEDLLAFPSTTTTSSAPNVAPPLTKSDYNKLYKPLPELKDAPTTTTTTTTSNVSRSDPDSIVMDFAQRVRKRSQSRSRMRPVAMDHTSSAPVPAMPVCNTLAQAIARSQSQPKARQTDSVTTNSSVAVPSTTDSVMTTSSNARELRSSPPLHSDGHGARTAVRGRQTQNADEIVEHRIYFAGMQRYRAIGIKRSACSRDLITLLSANDSLPADAGVGDWAIFDVRSDLGIERPLREYESVADVLSARNVINARRGALLLKRSDMPPYLNAQAVPKSAPALAGWMYVLDGGRKPSWNKRWCELRDGALFSAKSERGRDEVQICDLRSFDAYTPVEGECPWSARAPKKNAFALCNVTSAPAVHDVNVYYFCMSDQRAARHWVTAISRARTFILHTEAPGLFAVRSSSRAQASSAPTSDAVSAAPMARTNPTATVAASQPLVTLSGNNFEKGSLLDSIQHRSTQQPLARVQVNAGHRKPVPE